MDPIDKEKPRQDLCRGFLSIDEFLNGYGSSIILRR